MENKKVLLGLSGGIDSEYAARLLIDKGYTVIGMYINMLGKNTDSVSAVADKLKIDLIIKNESDAFQTYVITPFVESYKRGETPNPCVECNRFVKIDILYKESEKLGIPYIATGHYAKISDNGGNFSISKAKDDKKDQSYFLWKLKKEHLSKLIFPLGDTIKENVLITTENGYKESQDICFIPTDYRDFLSSIGVSAPSGKFIDTNRCVVGDHKGIINYTRGQRKGLGIALGYPAYVTKIDIENNTVTLGKKEDLVVYNFCVKNLNFQFAEPFSDKREFWVKTRYRSKPQRAFVELERDIANVFLPDGDNLVTSGQSAVFYSGDNIAFGGEIM